MTNLDGYRACCCFHVRTCTLIIGILELISLFLQLLSVACVYTKGQAYWVTTYQRVESVVADKMGYTTSTPISLVNQTLDSEIVTTIPQLSNATLSNATNVTGASIVPSNLTTAIPTKALITNASTVGPTTQSSEVSTTPAPNQTIDFFVPGRSLGGSIVVAIIGFPIAILLIVGVLKERPTYLIPHLGVQAIYLITIFIMFILYGVCISTAKGMAADASQSDRDSIGAIVGLSGFIISLLILVFLLNLYFFIVVLRCYRYLKEKGGILSPPGGYDSFR